MSRTGSGNAKTAPLTLAVTAALLGGCSLIPDYQRPDAPLAADWPQGEAYGSAASEGSRAAADLQWREFFRDPALQQLVQVALENNRDLRVAALNITQARAQLGLRSADKSWQVMGFINNLFVY